MSIILKRKTMAGAITPIQRKSPGYLRDLEGRRMRMVEIYDCVLFYVVLKAAA